LGVVLLLLPGAYGCGNLFSSRTVREREPEPQQPPVTTSYRFDDIPISSEMTLNRKDSFVFETGRIKTGLAVYETKGEMVQLTGFFKQKMPQYQWRLMSNFELNNVMLIFVKEGMTAVIYILPQEAEGKRIEIRVGPVEVRLLPTP
jgi:hypothetical protein